MQTITLRPMTETPERWPVCVVIDFNGHQQIETVFRLKYEYDDCDLAFQDVGSDGRGWFYLEDWLKFEAKEAK